MVFLAAGIALVLESQTELGFLWHQRLAIMAATDLVGRLLLNPAAAAVGRELLAA
jgi:hypothetical protein